MAPPLYKLSRLHTEVLALTLFLIPRFNDLFLYLFLCDSSGIWPFFSIPSYTIDITKQRCLCVQVNRLKFKSYTLTQAMFTGGRGAFL